MSAGDIDYNYADTNIGGSGTPGAPGANGADGSTVRNGSGVPSAGLGVDGDWYIDTPASTIYGPKAAGAWGSPASIVGPAGPAPSGSGFVRVTSGVLDPPGAIVSADLPGVLANVDTQSELLLAAGGASGRFEHVALTQPTPLGAGAVGDTPAIDTSDVYYVSWNNTSDVASAASGLRFQTSLDGTNWELLLAATALTAGVINAYGLSVNVPWPDNLRMHLTNGAGAQSYWYSAPAVARSSAIISQAYAPTPLVAGATWTGAALDMRGCKGFSCYFQADVASASSGATLEWSYNGTDWAPYSVSTFAAATLAVGTLVMLYHATTCPPYLRPKFTNGASDQARFNCLLKGLKESL